MSTHLIFASNLSKGQSLRALSNWMRPFIQLQLLLTVPESLVRLASGWLLEHGDSLFEAGMTARKKTLSNLTVLVTMINNSELHFIEITPHHCRGSLDNR